MKVKIIHSISGPDWSAKPGDIIDLPDGESIERWQSAGIAEPLAAPIETADAAMIETAAIKTRRKGK